MLLLPERFVTVSRGNEFYLNGNYGVRISGTDATENSVEGNAIGTTGLGAQSVGNTFGGVYIAGGASMNTIGGSDDGVRNVISGNGTDLSTGYGVRIDGSTTTDNKVIGNRIGTTADGKSALGNTGDGVLINQSPGNTVGGSGEGEANVISGNEFSGVRLLGSGAGDGTTKGNQVLGNMIGVDLDGTAGLGNGQHGVLIDGWANANTVKDNTVAANQGLGVYVFGANTDGNMLEDNYIGTNSDSDTGLGNLGVGVGFASGASGNTLSGNTIAANGSDGVQIIGSGTDGNMVEDNDIGTDSDSGTGLGNGNIGVVIANGASGNMLEGNTITLNLGGGVLVFDAGGNELTDNFVGTDTAGKTGLGNGTTLNKVAGVEISGGFSGCSAGEGFPTGVIPHLRCLFWAN